MTTLHPATENEAYQVVTYVDRTRHGKLRAEPVRRVHCHDEAGAILEAIRSLVVASTQPGLYWAEWWSADPASCRLAPDEPGIPNRAWLRTNGEIGLELTDLRGQRGLSRTQGRAAAIETPDRVAGLVTPHARLSPKNVRMIRDARPAERGAEGGPRPAREAQSWSAPELMREDMLCSGCSLSEVAREMSARFDIRPRTAWRRALAWSQARLADEYNRRYPGAGLTSRRVSDQERWPLTETYHRGPGLVYFVRLAETYGHGCTSADLADAHDLEHLGAIDWHAITAAINKTDEQRDPNARLSASDPSQRARPLRKT